MELFILNNAGTAIAGKKLLSGINFTLAEGENWAVFGGSGSGKTSLLKLLAGQLYFNSGTCRSPFLEYARGQGLYTRQKQMAIYTSSEHDFVNRANIRNFYYQQRFNAQDSADALTVGEYLKNKQDKAIRHNPAWPLDKVLGIFSLNHLVNEETIKLSNGESKRLKLAGAILQNPKVLLLDNPLTGLDIASRTRFCDLIDDIARLGISIVMTGKPDQLPACINRIAVMESGTIVRQGERAVMEKQHAVLQDAHRFDERLAEELLSGYTVPDYKIIAGLTGINISYGGKQVIRNLDWTVRQGDHWSLSGPNGSGKSTLLGLLTGDHPQAYANKIILFDKPRGSGESIWDIKRKIGYVSPELQQYFPLNISCLHAIESGFYDTNGLFRVSQPEKAALAKRWMQVFGIDDYAHRLLGKVPKGVQRMCLLLRAIIKKPPFFIFDEACQDLDETYTRQFISLVGKLSAINKLTYIYVSHYKNELPVGIGKTLELEKL